MFDSLLVGPGDTELVRVRNAVAVSNCHQAPSVWNCAGTNFPRTESLSSLLGF